jgi:hypothetical protein
LRNGASPASEKGSEMILRRSLLSCAALAAVLVPAASAPAQYGGSAPPPPASTPRGASGQNQGAAPAAAAPTPATPAELQAGAACVIGQNAAAADALFATAPFSAEERQQAIALIREVQRCQHQRQPMATSPSLLRGALAEAVVESRFATPQAARTPALAAAPLFRSELATARPDAAAMVPVYTMAECTVVQHPELVRAWFATTPGTAEAAAALQALNPAFVACVPRGSQLNIDPRHVRGVLAEDLYRWSVVQRDGPASPWAAAPAAAAGAPPPTPQPH